jgi:hypothetical protein
MECRLRNCAAGTRIILVILVGIVRLRRPPIRAQTAKEIVGQDQEAGLGTEKIRINEDLAHVPPRSPAFRLYRELELIDEATPCSRDSATRSSLVVSLSRRSGARGVKKLNHGRLHFLGSSPTPTR